MRISVRSWCSLLCLLLPLLMCGLTGCSNVTIGATIITDRFAAATIPPFRIVPVTVSCNLGEQMLSGGWGITTPAYDGPVSEGQGGPNQDQQYFVAGSFPSNPLSWTAIFTNEATGESRGDVLGVVHVECLSRGAAPTIVSEPGTDPSSSNVTTPACPNGSTLTGGGYELTRFTNIGTQMVKFVESAAGGLSQWNVATNFTLGSIMGTGADVESFAVCTTDLTTSLGAPVRVTAPPAPTNAPPTQPTLATGFASCGEGAVPVGSGYEEGNNDNAFPLTTFYPDYVGAPPQWDVRAYALPGIPIDSAPLVTGGRATIIPVCAKIS